MTGVEAVLARGALKPAGTLIDALIGHKIEKIKKWSKDKEIQAHLKNERLTLLLERYITRSTKRASTVSTIVFPQEKIDLTQIYEPMSLISNRSFDEDTNITIDPNKDGASYLIIDEAGMGKSTYAKSLCLSILKDSNRIPVLFELSEFDETKSLIENIAGLFDEIDEQFNRDLIKKLIVGGYLFIILDGYDEVPSATRRKLSKEISNLSQKKEKSPLMLTSRPQDSLPQLMDSEIYEIYPLTTDQAISILKRYDNYSERNIGENLIKELERVPDRFLQTPLLVGLLYRTYGFNGSIAEKITVFYGEIYDALYKGHDLTKSNFTREKESNLDIDQFRQLLQALCYFYIANKNEKENTADSITQLITNAKELCTFKEVQPRLFLNDLLLAVPLLTKVGITLKFMHRSIAEYFAAEFIANRKTLLDRILASKSSEQFRETIEYLYELSPNLYLEKITVPFAQSFLAANKEGIANEMHATVSYKNKWAVSFWKESTVRTRSGPHKGELEIPLPNNISYNMEYLYGTHRRTRYVACIAYNQNKNKLPRSACIELSNTTGIKFHYENNDVIKTLIENLEPEKWYYQNDPDLIKIIDHKNIETLLARTDTVIDRRDRGCLTISREKCLKAIEALSNIKRAEESLSKLLEI